MNKRQPLITQEAHRLLYSAACKLFPVLAGMAKFASESLWVTGGVLRSQLIYPGHSYAEDIDVVFFNTKEKSMGYEKAIERWLISQTGIECISVKNQARVNQSVDTVRYDDIFESIRNFPDDSVSWGLQLADRRMGLFQCYIPYGTSGICRRTIQPTQAFLENHSLTEFYSWLDRKNYHSRFSSWHISTSPCRLRNPRGFLVLKSDSFHLTGRRLP